MKALPPMRLAASAVFATMFRPCMSDEQSKKFTAVRSEHGVSEAAPEQRGQGLHQTVPTLQA